MEQTRPRGLQWEFEGHSGERVGEGGREPVEAPFRTRSSHSVTLICLCLVRRKLIYGWVTSESRIFRVSCVLCTSWCGTGGNKELERPTLGPRNRWPPPPARGPAAGLSSARGPRIALSPEPESSSPPAPGKPGGRRRVFIPRRVLAPPGHGRARPGLGLRVSRRRRRRLCGPSR